MNFTDQIVWITGASSGIGKALAIAFSQAGARVVLSARRELELEAVQKACTNLEKHYILPLDLTETDELKQKAVQVAEKVGPVDILVNNGGITQRSLVNDTDMVVVRKIMETNYFGSIAMTQAVLPRMLERLTGRIVFISSLTGKFGTPLRSIYASSKHAIMGFADALRAEVWASGVRVTVIMPGFVRTNASRNALTGDGSLHSTLDQTTAKGMLPEKCAQGILKALEAGKEEVIISGKEQIMVYLKRFFPGLFNKIIRKIKVT